MHSNSEIFGAINKSCCIMITPSGCCCLNCRYVLALAQMLSLSFCLKPMPIASMQQWQAHSDLVMLSQLSLSSSQSLSVLLEQPISVSIMDSVSSPCYYRAIIMRSLLLLLLLEHLYYPNQIPLLHCSAVHRREQHGLKSSSECSVPFV